MGFLDDVLGKIGGQQGQEGGLASISRLVSANGGLQGIMAKLTSNGQGEQVKSWVGTGDNEPVSGAEVRQALDDDSLSKAAQQAGTTPDKISEDVARVLPQVVSKATPQGQVPAQGDDPFAKGVSAIKSMLARS
ncbi:MAG TPA: YidB family protein [Streptosporangiaceae bacterium]|nr:YidB family protein [Streptosporangiaceae bacterium]